MKSGVYFFPFPKHMCVSGDCLKRANAEAIRFGFSRCLTGIKTIPNEMKLPIVAAMDHYSTTDSPPLHNIRLIVSVPTCEIGNDWRDRLLEIGETLEPCVIDVTTDAWATMLQQRTPLISLNLRFFIERFIATNDKGGAPLSDVLHWLACFDGDDPHLLDCGHDTYAALEELRQLAAVGGSDARVELFL